MPPPRGDMLILSTFDRRLAVPARVVDCTTLPLVVQLTQDRGEIDVKRTQLRPTLKGVISHYLPLRSSV